MAHQEAQQQLKQIQLERQDARAKLEAEKEKFRDEREKAKRAEMLVGYLYITVTPVASQWFVWFVLLIRCNLCTDKFVF